MADTPEDKKFSPMEKALPSIPGLDIDKDDAASGSRSFISINHLHQKVDPKLQN